MEPGPSVTNNNNDIVKPSAGRGRGRGRGGDGRGRGRGRGRGGRGRGGSHANPTGTGDEAPNTADGSTPPGGRGGGRGKSRRGRGGGRGGGGRKHEPREETENNTTDSSSAGRGRGRNRGPKGGRGGRSTEQEHRTCFPRSNDQGAKLTEETEPSRAGEPPAFENDVILSSSEKTSAPDLPLATAHHLVLPEPPQHLNAGGMTVVLRRGNATTPATTTFHRQHGNPSVDDELDAEYETKQRERALSQIEEEQHISEKLAVAALQEDDEEEEYEQKSVSMAPTSLEEHDECTEEEKKEVGDHEEAHDMKTKKKKNRRKKRDEQEDAEEEPVVEEEVPVVVTTIDAIKALPAQEVSIGAKTVVQVRRSESTGSLSVKSAPTDGVIDLVGKSSKKTGAKPKRGKGKGKGLGSDDIANNKAARQFNRSVLSCVEKSDPDGMADILHDKRNHHFALDASVLETVMKAYIMAAMFDEALYCLRNCTLPGTLSCMQTERTLICLPQNLRNSSAYTAADMINALCIATDFDKPTSRTYFLRVVRGIALEFLEEATSARDRICSAPCERLVRSAQCVVDAQLRRGKKPTEIVVVPGHQLGVFVPDTLENRGIQSGDAVSILPYAGPYPMSAESLDRNMIEATVTSTQPMVLRLQDKSNASLHAMLTEQVEGNVYRIDKLANRMGFNRQLAAAVSVASPLLDEDNKALNKRDARRPSPELIKAISAMDENIDRVMMLNGGANNNMAELTSTAALCAQAVPWSSLDDHGAGNNNEDALRDTSSLALEKYGALEGLNGSQRMAVEGAATNRLTLVQGPPGTGKTAVAIRILQHWARLAASEAPDGQNPNPILATSDSNIAVDNLVEGCANVGLRVVRLGRPEAIRPELLRYCIDRPQGGGQQGGGGGYGGGGSAFKEKMKNLKNAQVVCCTCIGSGGDILDSMTFERVLVDEATQATEPAVLVPITRGCRQLVLVGDHCQLPPTVLSTRAEEEGLGVPLFSRMVACGVPPFMLDTQYRMHPGIAMFPSDLFYGGKLNNGVSPPERRPLAGFPWPREEFPVAFVPVNHGVELDDGVSKLNEAEAAAACDAVAALLAGGQCTVGDIAVVTPYAAQVRLIRRLTRKLTQNRGPPFVEVSSTDGFQGREKEAVIFSAVRSNDYGAVGFVSDWRRVNVSFTRARRALIVIGNDQTLRRGDPDTWMPWLAWADAHGLNMDRPGVPRGRYDPEQLRRVRGGTTAAEMLKDVLARQQAQLKVARKQLENAEKKAAGHIVGISAIDDADSKTGSGTGNDGDGAPKTLQEDLAMLANSEGNWDDSDDEGDFNLSHSISQPTLATVSSSQRLEGSDNDDEPTDAWDL
eukprot:scaffold133473_cov53-Attheya_sp.AAC.2